MTTSVETTGAGAATRTYRSPMPLNWWLRNPRYLLYVLRDLSPLPVVIWLLVFLSDIRGLSRGASTFHDRSSIWFVAFSVFCLACALLHAVTWPILTGVVMRVRLGSRIFPAPLPAEFSLGSGY
jgi:succinate dehydrogenase subunit C